MLRKTALVGFFAMIGLLLVVVNQGRLDPSDTQPPRASAGALEPGDRAQKPYALLPDGRSVMTEAAYRGDSELLAELMRRNAALNLNHRDANGHNALDAAVAGGHFDLADKLIEYGAILDQGVLRELSRGYTAEDEDAVRWYLYRELPLADPQILRSFYTPGYGNSINDVLAAGYTPDREEARVMLEEYLSGKAYYRLFRLYPDLFDPQSKMYVFNPVSWWSASPQERLMMEAFFPTIPYVEDDWDFDDLVEKMPYEIVARHPDFAAFGSDAFHSYCATEQDDSLVLLLDQGRACLYENAFLMAVEASNYALVQRYIDKGLDPAQYRAYDNDPILDIALNYASEEKLEMAKLLIDNGAVTDPQQLIRFHSLRREFDSRFDTYGGFDYVPLKLAASPEDDLYVLAYSNEDHHYHLTRQGRDGTILWRYRFEGERFYNVLDNPAGLYFHQGQLLVAQNRYVDGARLTRLSLFNPEGERLQSRDVAGVFEALIVQPDGYAVTTGRTTALLDRQLGRQGDIADHPDAFTPVLPLETAGRHSHHRHFHYDLQKHDYYPQRTQLLFRPNATISSQQPVRDEAQFMALTLSADGETSEVALVGGGPVTAVDFAVSDSHAYVILVSDAEVVIQKRARDFSLNTQHYVEFDSSPFSTLVDSMDCDDSGCSLVGRFNDQMALVRTVPGEREQQLTRTETRYAFGSEEEALDWQIIRSGDQDFVTGKREISFAQGVQSREGELIRLEKTRALVPGLNGHLFAIGTHDGMAAYEELDAQGTLLGHHEFDFGYMDSHIQEMQQLPDGRLLMVGRLYQYFNRFKAYATLLTPEGKPIWSRIYHDTTGLYGLVADPDNNLFYSIDDVGVIAKLSLDDGSLIRQLQGIAGMKQLYRSADGRILALGVNETPMEGWRKRETIEQPFLYCLSPDESSFSVQLLGAPEDRILAVDRWKDELVVAYRKHQDGSTLSNVVLGRLDAQNCRISLEWP